VIVAVAGEKDMLSNAGDRMVNAEHMVEAICA